MDYIQDIFYYKVTKLYMKKLIVFEMEEYFNTKANTKSLNHQ